MKKIYIVFMLVIVLITMSGCIISTAEIREKHNAPEGYVKCRVVNGLRSGNGYINKNDIEKLKTDNFINIYWNTNLEVFSIINLNEIDEVVIGKHINCPDCL